MRDVVIAGAYMTAFGRHTTRTMRSLVAEAVNGALLDSGANADEIEMAYCGNVLGGLLQGQESIRGQSWLGDSEVGGLPVVNVENACASGSTALHQAWITVGAGLADVVIVVGAEKLTHETGNRPALEAMTSAADQDRIDEIRADLGITHKPKSLFMEVYAGFAQRYVEESGATQRDFALVSRKNHEAGSLNPKAHHRVTFTVEEILEARPIAGLLTLPMCAPLSDGAAAAVVATPEVASHWASHPVRILGMALGGARAGTYGKVVPDAARRAYSLAGIGPGDVDVVEVHDAAAPGELIAMEHLGLCGPGDAPKMVRAGETTIKGRLPVNPSGGLQSKGHPLGATGLGQVVDLCDQLRDRVGQRQVDHPEIGLAENAGGLLGPDVATASVVVLGRS